MHKNKRYEEQNMPGRKEVTFNTEMKAQVTTKIRIHKYLKFLFMEFNVSNAISSSFIKLPT